MFEPGPLYPEPSALIIGPPCISKGHVTAFKSFTVIKLFCLPFQQVHYGGMERFGESEEEETSKIEVRQDEKVEIRKMDDIQTCP